MMPPRLSSEWPCGGFAAVHQQVFIAEFFIATAVGCSFGDDGLVVSRG